MDHESTGARLAAAVAKLQRNPLLAASGHADTLKVLVEYLGERERRLVECETRLAVLERRARGG